MKLMDRFNEVILSVDEEMDDYYEQIQLKFIQILHKYSETLKIQSGVLGTPEEDEWIWLGNDEQIATECTELCRTLQKEAFEAGRRTKWPIKYCKLPDDMVYETFEEFIKEKNKDE